MLEFTVTLRLCPGQDLWMVAQAFSGLGDLAQDGVIAFRTNMTGPVDPGHGAIMWLDVVSTMGSRAICVAIDIHDRGDHFSEVGLATADIYFKRHYVSDAVRSLPHAVRDRVQPFGFWMPCLSWSAAVPFFKACFKVFLRGKWLSRKGLRLLKHNLLTLYGLPAPSAFLVASDQPREALVVFQTRLWPPEENSAAQDVHEVNKERAQMVRSLREAFGKRFVGGIVADAFSRTFCPDVTVAAGTSRRAYLRLTQRALVGVFTRGLHDTLGFRMPEYLGAGLAIVSKPIHDELIAPLVENRHYRAYQTIDECVGACDYLMTHPEEAARMRAENLLYFRAHCNPRSHFSHVLNQCLG